MTWEEPIINRVKADVDKIEEYDQIGYVNLMDDQKAEWMRGMIGALNATDLNRIESNQQYILRLLSNEYKLPSKTNWTMTDFVSEVDEDRILSNLRILIQPFDIGEVNIPEKPLNYFEKINIIENILLQIYDKYYSKVEYYGFLTDEGQNFLVDEGDLIVNDSKLRGEFSTDEGNKFITSENQELSVFAEQI